MANEAISNAQDNTFQTDFLAGERLRGDSVDRTPYHPISARAS